MRAELRALYFVSNVRREQSLQVQIFHMSDEGRASRLNYQTFSAEKVLKTDLTITRQNILQCINSSGNSRTWALQRYLCTVKIDDEMVQPPEFMLHVLNFQLSWWDDTQSSLWDHPGWPIEAVQDRLSWPSRVYPLFGPPWMDKIEAVQGRLSWPSRVYPLFGPPWMDNWSQGKT